jgi:competence protein ComEA
MKRLRRALLAACALLAVCPAGAQAPTIVEVNTASRAQLESVPGIGPQLADRLLTARPFANWPDLLRRVKGLGRGGALKLSAAGLRVDGQALNAASEAR